MAKKANSGSVTPPTASGLAVSSSGSIAQRTRAVPVEAARQAIPAAQTEAISRVPTALEGFAVTVLEANATAKVQASTPYRQERG